MTTYHPTPDRIRRDAGALHNLLTAALRRLDDTGHPAPPPPPSERTTCGLWMLNQPTRPSPDPATATTHGGETEAR
jgi:hypothetical protein